MSFKIFSLQLTGKIKPVEKTEQQRQTLYNDYLEFIKTDKSEELASFLELEQEINSAAFKNRKNEIQSLQFKDSEEHNLLKEFEKLKSSKKIKKYLVTEGSEALKRFEALKESEKIKSYYQLWEYVKEGDFEKEKKEIQSQVYKGSTEERHFLDYNKLLKSPGIKAYMELAGSQALAAHENFAGSEKLKKYLELKNTPERDKQKRKEFKILKKEPEIKSYFKFEHSKKLKLYHETAGSYNLKKLEELKAYVENDSFKERVAHLKDKQKFEKSEAFKKWQNFKQLAADQDVKFYLKFEKSADNLNYLDVKNSFELKRYFELKNIVSSEDFQKRKAYLEDKKKWEKSEEYAREQKYLEMKQWPHLVNYFKYKGTSTFDFFETWEVSFEDDFAGSHLNAEKWSTSSLWAEKALGRNYSMPGDLHLFSEGKNIQTGGKMVIETRKEKADGMVWQMPAGFVPATFDYTSGIASSAKSFSQEDGIFEAKIKFEPEKEVVSSFGLQGEKSFPAIYLPEMGAKNRIGVATLDANGKLQMNGLDISNLKKGKWYIFTFEKSGKSLSWKINDTEVLRMDQQNIDFPLHIHLQSIVLSQISGSKLPVRFQTGWIKCYKKK